MVTGESGVGKSALLANWALEYRAHHPQNLLIPHFIGTTPASTDWAAMVRRILEEFNRRLSLKVEITDKTGSPPRRLRQCTVLSGGAFARGARFGCPQSTGRP